MKKHFSAYLVLGIVSCCIGFMLTSGCANIIPPGGGPKDTLPPMLLMAVPKDSSTNFTGNRIVLSFDEYVDLQKTFENIIVSPLPKNIPVVSNNFRTVTIKIKDTLEENTTYSIDFGNALRDINEGNIAKNFRYVFSTGNTIDQNTISGKVIMAETGRIDSSLVVVLHRNTDDSAVAKERPRYLAKLDGKGKFQFNNLPTGNFALYAIPNGYAKQFDDSTKPFAFADAVVNAAFNSPVTLYAYTLPKKDTVAKTSPNNGEEKNKKHDKPLRSQLNIPTGKQDILSALLITFSKKIGSFDSAKFILTDTNYKPVTNYKIKADTTTNGLNISLNWPPNAYYKLIIDSTAVTDSTGGNLARNDTISFSTKKLEDYGSIRLRFTNLDLTKSPVLQIVQNDKIVESSLVTQKEWSRKLFNPGEYEMRILYDNNKNGIWDPGHFFGFHRQPEIVITLNTKLSVRANWDNEKDITL